MSEEDERDDSVDTDELLEQAQSTIPPGAPDSDRKARERAVAAWNALASRMVEVIKTIRKNELRLRWALRLVWVAILIGIIAAFYLAMQAERTINMLSENMLREQRAETAKMTKKQEATLNAIAKLSEAVGKKLEADVDPSPGADDEAAVAALDAQEAALKAKKEVTDSYVTKAAADREIREVELKKADKKNGASKRAPDDDEGLSRDKPYE
jgi:hypothetical protein